MFLDFDRNKAREKALKKEATAGTNPPASNNIIPGFEENKTLDVKKHEDKTVNNSTDLTDVFFEALAEVICEYRSGE